MLRHKIAKRVAGAALTVVSALGICAFGPTPAQAESSYRITLGMDECGVMAVGVTGTCIVSLQTWLNIFDHANLVVDGKFGPKTKLAVINFQNEHGLTPDGRFGKNSRNALRGEFQYMMENSVATPRLEKNEPVTVDVGGAEPGLDGGLITAFTCIGVGIVAGTAGTPAVGVGAEVACVILLE
jgi:hypothetical protein